MMKFGAALVAVLALSSIVLAAPDFEALGRTVVEELSARSFDKVVERFDQKMLAALPKEKLAATWNSVIGKVGAFKSVTAVRIQDLPQQGVRLVELTSTFEKMNVFIRVAFNAEGNIAGLFFSSAPLPTVQWTRLRMPIRQPFLPGSTPFLGISHFLLFTFYFLLTTY